MTLPAGLARFNRRLTNRVVAPLAGRSRLVDRLDHVGRTSGHCYSTPIKAFMRNDGTRAYIVLSYGPGTDWARNILVAPARLVSRGKVRQVSSASIVATSDPTPRLTPFVLGALRLMGVDELMRLELGPTQTGGEPVNGSG